jgi:hypothetical protein
MAEDLQEQLLAREEELTQREEALATREEKARISEKTLAKVAVHTAHAKHSLSLDKMSVEKKVELDGRERDLNLCEVTLAEAQSRGLNPQDDC